MPAGAASAGHAGIRSHFGRLNLHSGLRDSAPRTPMTATIRLYRFAALGAALLLCGGTSQAQESPSHRMFGREAPPQRQAQASAPDLIVRMDRLENQLRQLTGMIEQLQFRNQQLEQQVKRFQEDTEFRLQEQGGRGGARPGPATTQARPPAQ